MEAGAYSYEWFDPNTALTTDTGLVTVQPGNNTFTPPFSGSAVVYLKSTTQTGAATLSGDDSSFPDIDGARAIPRRRPMKPCRKDRENDKSDHIR
jgi:hypothetical protein